MTAHDLRHGGALDKMRQDFPAAPQPWIDLSTGINPWAWPIPPNLIASESLLAALPTATQRRCCQNAMAAAYGSEERCVLPVPGSASAIAMLPHTMDAKTAAVMTPSYGDYARAWRASGAAVIEMENPLEAATTADVICVCQPNNPDGRRFDRTALIAAADQLAKRGGHLIVDEAYADLDPAISLANEAGHHNIIVFRSFGKFFGLAGLRLGAVIAPQNILAALRAKMGDWPISTLALAIGARAYQDTSYQNQTRKKLRKARCKLDTVLRAAGLPICGGTDLFCFTQAGSSTGLWRHLAQNGIYIRRFEWSDTHVRIGLPADEAAVQRLNAALMAWHGSLGA